MRNPIVGVGELLWDIFPDGRKVAGGAPFNFAFHCQQLGHDAVIVSRVGDDDLGRELRAEVRRLGLTDDFIQTDARHPTGTVRVAVDAHGQPTYTITEDVAWDYIEWDERTARALYHSSAICFGTLAQRNEVSASTIQRWLSNAYGFVGLSRPFELFDWADTRPERELRQRLILLDMNLRQHYYTAALISESLRSSTWVKLSIEELAVLVGMFNFDWSDDLHAVGQLGAYSNWNQDVVCLSRGSAGCLAYRKWEVEDEEEGTSYYQEEIIDEPGVPARVVDTVGAGDAFTAAMVCLHLEGRPLRECARFANHYAARVCEFRGATPRIDRADIERAVS